MLSTRILLEEAKSAAGLDDYGDMGFLEGLDVLVDSINAEAGLTSENEIGLKRELERVLVNRLRMQLDLTKHPAILEEQILRPVFITSMPRTGSTKLHRLLAATGNFNVLKFWHTYHFARIPGTDGVTPDPRIADAERYLQWLYQRAPIYQQYHPMYTNEAEEELFLLDAGFNSLYRYAVMLNVPSYVQWVLSSDGLHAFRDLRRILQYLQWQQYSNTATSGRRRWILKTPALFGLEASFSQVFPDMNFIVTHRHPAKTLASVCGLFCGVRRMYYDHDATPLVRDVAYNFGESLKGHLHWRAQFPAERVLDLRFDEVMNDEIGVLDRVHSFLDIPLDASAIDNVKEWIAMDALRGHLRSTTSLEDFGITADAVNERFSGYVERYREFLPATPT